MSIIAPWVFRIPKRLIRLNETDTFPFQILFLSLSIRKSNWALRTTDGRKRKEGRKKGKERGGRQLTLKYKERLQMYFSLSKLPNHLIYLGGSDFPPWISLPEGMLLVHNEKGKTVLSLLYKLIRVGSYPGREISEPSFKGNSMRSHQLKQ